MSAKSFRETAVYKKAFALAMQIFEISKSFPKEEIYSLTSQIRRASRSVCTNLAEAYRKKIYVAHFISKVTDSRLPIALCLLPIPVSNENTVVNDNHP